MNKSRYVFFILACLFGLYVQAQNRTVKGRVLSAEDKEPLIGATVKIPGTSIGVVTDIDGNFSLEVPNKDKTLVIEFLGGSRNLVGIGIQLSDSEEEELFVHDSMQVCPEEFDFGIE